MTTPTLTVTPILTPVTSPVLVLPPVTIHGTNASETLNGNFWSNTIHGYGGNDRINGQSGHDRMFGGAGNDTIDGGTGNDTAYGGSGNDRIVDGDGDDLSYGGSGNDTIIMGDGDDTAYGQWGDDYIYAYNGGANTLHGGSGRDILYVYDDRAAGHFATDTNKMYGGSGNDALWLVGGAINAFGGSGDDVFRFFSGPENAWHFAEGGAGNDDFFIHTVNKSLFIQIDGFDDMNETMTFYDGFGAGVSTLDSNGNGVLDTGDTYVTAAGGFHTRIQNGDLDVLIWENGFLDADAFMIA